MPHTLQLPTLCSSCKRPGSCYLSLPACHLATRLFIAAQRNKLPLLGLPAPHAPCNIRAIDAAALQLKRKKEKRRKNAMGQLATCHLPLERRQGSCCTLVCLAIESALSYLPKGELGGAGPGAGAAAVACLIDAFPHLPHGSFSCCCC